MLCLAELGEVTFVHSSPLLTLFCPALYSLPLPLLPPPLFSPPLLVTQDFKKGGNFPSGKGPDDALRYVREEAYKRSGGTIEVHDSSSDEDDEDEDDGPPAIPTFFLPSGESEPDLATEPGRSRAKDLFTRHIIAAKLTGFATDVERSLAVAAALAPHWLRRQGDPPQPPLTEIFKVILQAHPPPTGRVPPTAREEEEEEKESQSASGVPSDYYPSGIEAFMLLGSYAVDKYEVPSFPLLIHKASDADREREGGGRKRARKGDEDDFNIRQRPLRMPKVHFRVKNSFVEGGQLIKLTAVIINKCS